MVRRTSTQDGRSCRPKERGDPLTIFHPNRGLKVSVIQDSCDMLACDILGGDVYVMNQSSIAQVRPGTNRGTGVAYGEVRNPSSGCL